jgi:hypothetical protein
MFAVETEGRKIILSKPRGKQGRDYQQAGDEE